MPNRVILNLFQLYSKPKKAADFILASYHSNHKYYQSFSADFTDKSKLFSEIFCIV